MYRLNKPSYYFIVATLCLMMFPVAVQGQLETFFTKSDAFFKAYVTDGKVKYDRLANTTALDDLIKQVEETSLLSQGEASIKAFYINAYNLLVIKGALSGYPLSSVQDIPFLRLL
ncbi:MAG: hypothetical protein AAF388_08150 [Bacteroidota bacterium]